MCGTCLKHVITCVRTSFLALVPGADSGEQEVCPDFEGAVCGSGRGGGQEEHQRRR